jgi:hypothetical protein
MAGLLTIISQFIKDKEFRRLTIFVVFIILGGAIFYHQVEGWGWLDSFYFCVTTLTTVGYGDFSPATSSGKIFTIFYILIGIGIILGYITVVAKIAIQYRFGLFGILSEKTRDLGGKTIQTTSMISEKTRDLGGKTIQTTGRITEKTKDLGGKTIQTTSKITGKTRDLGEKTWNIGKRVKEEEVEPEEEEEEEPEVKKQPPRRQPMQKYPMERLK